MRNILNIFLLTGSLFVFGQIKGQTDTYRYAPSFRYCPDRKNDIAWENDLVAFRVYGHQPDPKIGLSGIDAWHKRVSYPILDKWYKANRKGQTYHKDYGEGCDRYHVGKSRGVGGLGLWINEKIIASPVYESWEVTSQTIDTIQFKLTYSWNIDGNTIHETRIMTLKNGSQLYSANSVFKDDNGKSIKDLSIAIGLSTQNGIAQTTLNEERGWMSAWHTLRSNQGMVGTGVIVDKHQLVQMIEMKSDDKDNSHILAIVNTNKDGSITWHAGFAWEKALRITNRQDWNQYLETYKNSK